MTYCKKFYVIDKCMSQSPTIKKSHSLGLLVIKSDISSKSFEASMATTRSTTILGHNKIKHRC